MELIRDEESLVRREVLFFWNLPVGIRLSSPLFCPLKIQESVFDNDRLTPSPYRNPQQVPKLRRLWLMNAKFVREVGKMEQKLWENVWLKRGEFFAPCFNCHEPEESDCLIKTKRLDGARSFLTKRDFCPVLWISFWRNSNKYWLTAGVTMTLLR